VCAPPEFMPDGRLAVGDTVYDPSTGVTIKMPLQVSVSEMAWSPNGEKLAFITGDHKEIRVASPDGNNAVTKVREARGLLSSLSWAPSSDRFAFIAQDDPTTILGPGPPTVNIYNVANGQRSQAGPGLAVAWSPAGDVFAVDRASGVVEVGNPAGGRRRLVAGREGSWSPDGRFIAFIRPLDAGPTGWVADANGSAPAQVSEPGVCGMSFSASGTAVAMVTAGGGGPKRLVLRPVS
jgi:Tol biopolymer transport system component